MEGAPRLRLASPFGRSNPTADHILPREWRVVFPSGVRATKPAHQSCNEMRGRAGHCVAVLACALAVASSGGRRQWEIPGEVGALLRQWARAARREEAAARAGAAGPPSQS